MRKRSNWSAEARADLGEGSEPQRQSKIISDTHNAALDAEREKVTLATQMVQIESKRANEAEQKVQTYEGALIKIANDPNCDRCQVAVDALAKVAK